VNGRLDQVRLSTDILEKNHRCIGLTDSRIDVGFCAENGSV